MPLLLQGAQRDPAGGKIVGECTVKEPADLSRNLQAGVCHPRFDPEFRF